MAWQFHDQIAALTGFDSDSSTTVDSGETYRIMTGQWLTDAAKEVINILPAIIIERCAKKGTTFVPGTGQNVESKVLSVQRAITTSFSSGEVYDCRRITHSLANKAVDVDSIEYATESDPVYYLDPQSDGTAVKVKVLPISSSSIARVYSVDYPTITYTESEIPNFPDEAVNLVVLKAAITAAEYLLAIEEDIELYTPVIANLRAEYMQGVNALKSGNLMQPQVQKQ